MFLLTRLKFKYKDWRLDRRSRKQRKRKGFADSDCWGLNYWLCDTFPKMIENLRDMKHGAPDGIEFEEFEQFPLLWVNEQAQILLKQKKKQGYEEEINIFGDDKCFDRWWFILSRIAWCLREASPDKDLYNEYEQEYNEQLWGKDDENLKFKDWWDKHTEVVERDEKGKPKFYTFKQNKVDPELEEKYFKKEEENARYQEQMKNEAMDLIKKYFFCLWD